MEMGTSLAGERNLMAEIDRLDHFFLDIDQSGEGMGSKVSHGRHEEIVQFPLINVVRVQINVEDTCFLLHPPQHQLLKMGAGVLHIVKFEFGLQLKLFNFQFFKRIDLKEGLINIIVAQLTFQVELDASCQIY